MGKIFIGQPATATATHDMQRILEALGCKVEFYNTDATCWDITPATIDLAGMQRLRRWLQDRELIGPITRRYEDSIVSDLVNRCIKFNLQLSELHGASFRVTGTADDVARFEAEADL